MSRTGERHRPRCERGHNGRGEPKETVMAKYLVLKHYQGGPTPYVHFDPLDRWAPDTDGPFAETKDVIASWMVIDVDSYERALELAAELSAAPGQDGKPLHE